jgi:hypothetical protein
MLSMVVGSMFGHWNMLDRLKVEPFRNFRVIPRERLSDPSNDQTLVMIDRY